MKTYVTYTRGNQQRVIKKLNTSKLFSKINTQGKDKLRLETKKPVYKKNKKIIAKFVNFFEKMRSKKHIKQANLYLDADKKQRRKKYAKILHIFFDIDSTLTHTGVKLINKDVRSDFDNFKKQGCRIYFCTGRSLNDVKDLNQKYELGDYGIAEAGGIILGVGSSILGFFRHGRKKEPNNLIGYMKKNEIDYKEDLGQPNRLSEWVLNKKSITKKTLKNTIRDSKAKVEYHMTKNTIHITAKGVNKGTAILFLTSDVLDLDSNDFTIGVGDSDLDIEMFKHCDESYVVGDDPAVRRVATYKLRKKPPKSVSELYDRLFPF